MRKKISLLLSLCLLTSVLITPAVLSDAVMAAGEQSAFQTVVNNFDDTYCEYLGDSDNAEKYLSYTKQEHTFVSGWYYNKIKGALPSERNITQNDVFIEYESSGNKAMHFKHLAGYSSKTPSGFVILNKNGENDFYNTCIKEKEGQYKISLKAKGITNNVNIYAGWTSAVNENNYTGTHIDNFTPGSIEDVNGRKNIAMVYDVSGYSDWKELEFTFDIGDNPPPDPSSGLYICIISQGSERKEADWWIDDVTVERVYVFDQGESGKPWSGMIAKNYAGGNGTEADPYQIATPEQLARLVKLGSGYGEHYILTDNIIINSDLSNNPRQWYGYNDTSASFKGNFDGQGFTVSGLYFSGADSAALFPKVYSGDVTVSINNLIIADSYIKAEADGNKSNMAAAFAGFSNDNALKISFYRCIAESSVTVEGDCAAGFLARAANPTVTVDSCAFTGKLKSGEGKPYGAVFATWNASITVKNSFFNCIPATSLNLANLSVANSYAVENPNNSNKFIILTAEQMQGNNAKENMPLLDWENVWEVRNDGYPKRLKPIVWNGTADNSWKTSVGGTEKEPYIISTAEQLYSVASASGSETQGKYFKLANNINLNNTEIKKWYSQSNNKEWLTANGTDGIEFKGVFDGGNNTVYGLYYNGNNGGKYCGLFPVASDGAVIKNLNIDKAYINIPGGLTEVYTGVLAGTDNGGRLKIHQCCVGEEVEIFAKNGSLAGKIDGNSEITSSAFLGTFGEVAGNALKITQMRTYNSTWPRYFLITDNDKLFRPEFGIQYTVSFKYKVVKAASRDICLELRWTRNTSGNQTAANGDGPSGVNSTVKMDPRYRIVDLVKCEKGKTDTEWQTAEKTFTVNAATSPTYQIEKRGLSVVINDGNKWTTDSPTDIELWIDDLEIKQGDRTVLLNDYDSVSYKVEKIGTTDVLKTGEIVVSNNNNIVSVSNGGLPLTNNNKGFAAVISKEAKLCIKDSYTTAFEAADDTGTVTYENTYCTGTAQNGLLTAPKAEMRGRKVMYEAMKELNWGIAWKTSDSYPLPITSDDIFGGVGAVWSGKCATWMEGAGTVEYPFIVDTPERLYLMVTKPVKSAEYLITEDIKLNNTASADWYQKSNLNSWYEASSGAFEANVDSGKKDGTLARISGLYRKEVSENCALIPILGSNAHIRNLRITDAFLSGTYDSEINVLSGSSIAGITAKVSGNRSLIEGCIVEESVTLKGAWSAGGIVAVVPGQIAVRNCAFRGKYDKTGGRNAMGGIVCGDWGTTQIESCYTVGTFLNYKLDATFGHIYNCYSDIDIINTPTGLYHSKGVAVLEKSQMRGGKAAEQMCLMDFNNIWSTTDGYPDILKKITAYDGEEGAVWSGKKAGSYSGGSGTQNDPYIIKTGEQLFKMMIENSPEAYYRLEADIILNQTDDENWYESAQNLNMWRVNTIDGFKGHLDGNYHTVSGLYYNTGEYGINTSVALIPYAASGSSVEKVGVINSYLLLPKNGNCAAAIVGEIRCGTTEKRPVISECFADNSVYIEASYAGGIVGKSGASPLKGANPVLREAPVEIVNCSFTGSVVASKRNAGTMIGYVRGASESLVKNCFGSSLENERMIGGSTEYGSKRPNNDDGLIEDCYYYATNITAGANALAYADRKGLKAETVMSKLDFENIWLAVEDGTPVLRGFREPERFSDRNLRITTIKFITGDSEVSVAPISGEIESALNLPTPVRKGYIFDGWYVYEEYQILFESKTMPLCNLTLYAKWIRDSVVQDFENYPNTDYDKGNDYEYFRPGTVGYNALYTHGGYKSMHRKGASSEAQDMLLNYEQPLTVGQKYEMTFWLLTDQTNVSADISLVHNTWPDIAEPISGTEKIVSVSSLKVGEWTKYTYTFTAKTQWVSIRTTGNASLYFDDFMLCPIGERVQSVSSDISALKTGDSSFDPVLVIAVICISFAVLTLSLFALRKCKKEKRYLKAGD